MKGRHLSIGGCSPSLRWLFCVSHLSKSIMPNARASARALAQHISCVADAMHRRAITPRHRGAKNASIYFHEIWALSILNHCVKIIHIYQEKIGGEIMMQIQYLYDKINGFKQKNQNFIGRFLQKSTRWQRPWSKMHRIKKRTPLRKTNFLSTTTLRFIPRMIRAL